MRTTSKLFAAVLVLAFAGCKCDRSLSGLEAELIVTEPTTKDGADYVADFGAVEPGNFMSTVTVQNLGTVEANLTQIEMRAGSDPAFTLTGAVVPLPVAPNGEKSTFKIVYAPTHAGSSSGYVDVTTDDPKLPKFAVKVLGIVQATGVEVCVDDGAGNWLCNNVERQVLDIDFGAVKVGSPMLKRKAQVRSNGNKALDYFGTAFDMGASPLFGTDPNQTPGATATPLQPNEKYDFEFTYTPTTAGAATAVAFVNTSDGASPSVAVQLRARAALSTECHLVAAPPTVDFGSVVNNTAADQSVVIVNDGLMSCDLSAFTYAGSPAFTITNGPTVPKTLAPNDVLTFGVHYAAATGTANDTGTVTIDSNDPMTPSLVIPIRGSSIEPPPCQLIATPTTLDFGGVALNDRALRSVKLTATGDDICLVSGSRVKNGNTHFIAGSVPAFPPTIVTSMTGFLGAPEIGVTYAPTVARADNDILEISYTAGFGGPALKLNVPLTGRAGGRKLCLTPARLHFGPVANGMGKDLAFTMTACGGVPVTVQSLSIEPAGTPFSLGMGPAVPHTLAPAGMVNQTVHLTSNGMALGARVKVVSDDPTFSVQYVDIDTGPQLVSPDAGEVLYSWTAGIFGGMNSSVFVTKLQGPPDRQPFYGSAKGQACAGCHSPSPDGKYIALVEYGTSPTMRIIDARTGGSVPVAGTSDGEFPSWNPNVNTTPPYQFVYAAGGNQLKIASVSTGIIRTVTGASDPNKVQTQPTWGPNGTIAFVKGEPADAGVFEIKGPCDLMTVPEGGGTAIPVAGASGNGGGNYMPEYSPNGKYIAYTHSPAGMTSRSAPDSLVKLVDTTTGQVLPLPQLNAQVPNSWPTWARDGSFLSFSSTRPGTRSADVYFAPVDQNTGADGPAMPLSLVNTAEFDHIARWAFLPPP